MSESTINALLNIGAVTIGLALCWDAWRTSRRV